MDFRALCVKLMMSVIILLCAHDQKSDAFSLHILPNRLQFFEYEAVTFYCEGVVYCEFVHKVKGKIKTCPKGSSCTITNVYLDDSGEYWYENEEGIRSNSINISITDGSVILESPAVPVMEGEDVTLSCRNKLTPSDFMADFYKYGVHIRNNSTGSMAIHKVSKSDEGLYKCSIVGVGESPESWLSVTETKTDPSSQPGCHIYLVLRTVFTIIMVALLLLLVGLLHSGKIRATTPNLNSIS
ncbi:low affinity immunoglobulin gamma Fc region receptor II-like isoform X1 [Simochromis diagramma]|uniref:low affinity immunoglobulin gamma Fc region receptor II-like isoform X1 n=1 Tax=Simochromis diagramma TaxID=43689 RepID=UPI001A7E3640|nr:low affinity immunoglobulin gamma Fc region receptor II-like isoform X1 [Simochromis diagramma]